MYIFQLGIKYLLKVHSILLNMTLNSVTISFLIIDVNFLLNLCKFVYTAWTYSVMQTVIEFIKQVGEKDKMWGFVDHLIGFSHQV